MIEDPRALVLHVVCREGVSGGPVGCDDPAALADAVARSVADAGIRRVHGASRRRRCEEVFSVESMAARCADRYESLLDGATRAGTVARQF